MALGIRVEAVCAALAPLLGERFVRSTSLCAHAAGLLHAFDPRTAPLDSLAAALKDALFGDLRAALGPDMLLVLESGVRLRLRLRDIDTLVDETLGVLLDACPYPIEALREYAMRTGSLSAMRVMLQRHPLPPMEREMWMRIVRENHPTDRYRTWLQG